MFAISIPRLQRLEFKFIQIELIITNQMHRSLVKVFFLQDAALKRCIVYVEVIHELKIINDRVIEASELYGIALSITLVRLLFHRGRWDGGFRWEDVRLCTAKYSNEAHQTSTSRFPQQILLSNTHRPVKELLSLCVYLWYAYVTVLVYSYFNSFIYFNVSNVNSNQQISIPCSLKFKKVYRTIETICFSHSCLDDFLIYVTTTTMNVIDLTLQRSVCFTLR